jgi:hypothetical protein
VCDRILSLILVQIFLRYIVFGHFTSADFLAFTILRVLNSRHNPSLERVTLLQQLVNTFRIDILDVRQALQIAGLPSGV